MSTPGTGIRSISTRSMRMRNLLVIVAVLASLVALGCWDNRRGIARVIEEGYDTSAQILGAQYQRTAPFAVEGWRPRFIEQALSVDLQWQGKDGKTHVFRKVPVSGRFERTIVNGEQVRLMTVPVKVLDDETSVPVLTIDAAQRLESLNEWLTTSGYLALAGWVVIAALTTMQWRRARMPQPVRRAAGARLQPFQFPIQRLMIGLVAVAVGTFMIYSAQAVIDPVKDDVKTTETMAEINSVSGPPYAVQLGWKDGQGGIHHFGPLHISDEYWARITKDGKLVVNETKVRFPVDDSMAQPVILDDAPGTRWQTKAVLAGGIALLLLGVCCLLWAARVMRR
jgi:hypothetical protein